MPNGLSLSTIKQFHDRIEGGSSMTGSPASGSGSYLRPLDLVGRRKQGF
ncbi:hypothetical protein [Amycolatopsis sp. EV170708-02-1]|nr:hypothetical protein [Amycolatopsis sp. EV170708-02-1]UMP06699.1 hypothetical protein MJQ72_18655 [Amycolatopsis sp. EV170708-02-1]